MMQQKKPSTQQLLQEIESLRREVEQLQREKADLQILLETATADTGAAVRQLYESNKQLQAEVAAAIALRHCESATQQAKLAEVQSLLAKAATEKADLEILLETTIAHADTVEQVLHSQNIRDPLTGLFNRRYMDQFLRRELRHAQRLCQPLGLILLDIDHFKRFNDTFGHLAGDAVLREMGRLLQAHQSSSDIACRYGGEELVLIVPATSLKETAARAEQVRQAVKLLNLEHYRQPLGGITISLGVACFPDHGQSSAALIRAADAALYRAKALGRDRLVTADSLKPL
ncbi:MAG: diguanylate cyclase [Oscillatoria princeps RMCB-10]|jgi:diguanylate cyclase (GGDEF)-like protein|nr:diguanylate cyclase [Oscillatoria princeps RMCB-10]